MSSLLYQALLLSSLAGGAVAATQGIAASPASFASTAFDFIVVGGGTGGLAVAARLAENPAFNVGVIEAGLYRPNDTLIDVPGFFGRVVGNPDYDWKFTSVPQVHAANAVINLTRGKVLGGTSAVNGMVYDRAGAKEYDAWAQLGSPGWSWNEFLPYLKKAENYHPPTPDIIFPGVSRAQENAAAAGLTTYEGFNGPVQSSHTEQPLPFMPRYVEALNALGVPTNRNPDYGDATGVCDCVWAIDPATGSRSYSATTYFKLSAGKPNFLVLTGAQATKVVFSNSGGPLTATGVQFIAGGQTYTVNAKKEVILSAGAYQTPQLLELSGIGNTTLLSKFGIKTLVNLPQVGENLQDKTNVRFEYETKPGVITFDETVNNATYGTEQNTLYQTEHKGIWATPKFMLFFTPLNFLISPAQIAAEKVKLAGATALQKAQYKIWKDWATLKDVAGFETVLLPQATVSNPKTTGKNYITLQAGIMHPLSRGNVHIVSADPLAAPAIDYNWLADEFDAFCLGKISKFAASIAQTEPFKSLIGVRTLPPPSIQTDAQWDQYARAHAEPFFHPVGSAALAPQNVGGVVSPQLKVYGTKNLRVVDASIIPIALAAHPHQSVYAIAEKAADMIKAQYH